jgi:hypothetical protein
MDLAPGLTGQPVQECDEVTGQVLVGVAA